MYSFEYEYGMTDTTNGLHNLIKTLTELIEQAFYREGLLYLACNEKCAYIYIYFTYEQHKRLKLWSCQKVCEAFHFFGQYIYKIWLKIIQTKCRYSYRY